MALYFLDSLAVVKRYFQEQGHEWIETLHEPAQGHELYIAQIALVEVVASICRKAREQNIPFEERDTTIDDFRRDVQNIYSVWMVDNALYTAADDLCRSHRLRAYDACTGYLARLFLKMRSEQHFSIVLFYNFLKVYASNFDFL